MNNEALTPIFEPEVSSITWLGIIPTHWTVKRLKWSVTGVFNGIWGNDPDGVDDVICVRVADFDRIRQVVVDEPPTLRSVEAGYLSNRTLKQGDLLIEKSGGGDKQLVGCVVHFNHKFDAVCSNFVGRLPPAKGMQSQFWSYVHASLYSVRLNFPAIKQTTGIQNLDAEAYLNLKAPFPPIKEQCIVADYLDRETARIDALVAEKESILALLKEKQVALISHAVTRGLDPNVSLKPSGLDWLGDIPEHWNLLRLKFLLDGIEQGSSPQCYSYPAENEGWGVLKSGCSNGGVFRESENKALPADIEPSYGYQVHINDVLMSRASGSVDLIGSVAYVENEPAARLLLSDKTYRLLLKHEIMDYRFLVFTMGADFLRHQIRAVISGAEGLANNIAKSDILEFSLAVPPLSEQKEICLFIDKQLNRNVRLKLGLKDSIALLKERRAALITAAVTGQIPLEKMAS